MKIFILKTAAPVALLLYSYTLPAQIAAVKFTVQVPGVMQTDKGVYLAGSFNYWHENDTMYRMKNTGNNVYTLTIPVFKGKQYEYKYCLGNWNRVETAGNDSNINNRQFTAFNKQHIYDTVVKWKPVPTVADSSPQLKKFVAMKDSLAEKIKPEIGGLMEQLKLYAQNLLQAQPSMEEHNRLDSGSVEMIGHVYRQVTGLLWKLCNSLTPEQRQQALKKLNAGSGKDFFNTFLDAINGEAK